jgi:ketosteroid isomerase-like protein
MRPRTITTMRKDDTMTAANDQSKIAVVERFLQAMSDGDVDAMFAENASELVASFPTAPGGPQVVRGWDTNRAFYSTYIRPMWSTYAITRHRFGWSC